MNCHSLVCGTTRIHACLPGCRLYLVLMDTSMLQDCRKCSTCTSACCSNRLQGTNSDNGFENLTVPTMTEPRFPTESALQNTLDIILILYGGLA